MVFLVQCPICKDSKTHDIKPIGLLKCKACNSLFAPRPIDQNSRESSNTLAEISFSLDFSESDSEVGNEIENEDNEVDSFTTNSKADQKSVKDNRFVLEFSDSDGSDSEGTKITRKRSLRKKRTIQPLSDSEEEFLPRASKQKKEAFKPLSDSEKEEEEFSPRPSIQKKKAFKPLSDSEEEFLPRANKQKDISVNTLFDSEEEEYEEEDDDESVVNTYKQKKKASNSLSDPDYDDSLPESNTNKRAYRNLFDSEDEEVIGVMPKITFDWDLFTKDIEIPRKNKSRETTEDVLFSDEDSLEDEEEEENPVKKKRKVPEKKAPVSEEEEEVYNKGDVHKPKSYKKSKKLTAVPEIILDEDGNVIKKTQARYRFTHKPGNKYNPYILFNKEYRSKFKEANPGIGRVELNLLVGKAYRELDPEKKKKLIENSRKLTELNMLEETTNKETVKCPRNALQLFKEANKDKYRDDDTGTLSLDKYMNLKWKILSETEKDVYKKEARNRKLDFMVNNPILYKEMTNRAMSRNLASRRLALKKRSKSGDSSE